MTFTTTTLLDNRVLVQGTDFLGTEGKAVLDASQWIELNKHKEFDAATAEFEAAVEEFFAPIMQAADKASKAKAGQAEDPISFVVLDDGQEGTPSRPAHVVKLTRDSMILRLLESGGEDRLAWVNDQLEILASSQVASAPAVPSAEEVTALGAEATGKP